MPRLRFPRFLLNLVLSFAHSQSFSGVLLIACTAVALGLANSHYAAAYLAINHTMAGFHVGSFALERSVQSWVNDGLMAVFFLLVGLEIKRELMLGQLNSVRKALFPVTAAIGGMAVPALLYVLINHPHPDRLVGWAIPSATDIAFALGVLLLMHKRIPRYLVLFLTAVAIADDLGAVLIIALFYNHGLFIAPLLGSCACFVVLLVLNRCNVNHLGPYLLFGFLLWLCLLNSGIHASIAGVWVAFTLPTRVPASNGITQSAPLQRLEHWLHTPVTYFIIPLFVLLNAGVSLQGVNLGEVLLSSVTLGVAAGLVFGKCLGIFGVAVLFIKTRWIKLPHGVSLRHFLPVSLIAGIGFTMSIFISELAFARTPLLLMEAKVGILGASVIAAVLGYTIAVLSSRGSTAGVMHSHNQPQPVDPKVKAAG